jgi:hypothetical protein
MFQQYLTADGACTVRVIDTVGNVIVKAAPK